MRYRRLGALTVLAMLSLGLNIGLAGARSNRAVLGSVATAGGTVRVDRVDALPGTAVMEGDVIATESKSDAIIDLRSGTKITVAEKTEVAFLYDSSTTRLDLREGSMLVQTGGGKTSQVSTRFATSVVVEGVDGFPASCRIALAGRDMGVMNEKGRVEIHGVGVPILLPVGKYVVLRAGAPQAGSEAAGKVDAAIPAEVVDRQASANLPLNVNDPVYWQDLVRTEKTGRVRIELTGGSFLNVGAHSQMRIVRHEAGSQQTELELKLGSLRGQIMKLTKPGASFQIKTQTAVIGVVGTDLIIIATAKSTRVICLDGAVQVTSLAPAVAGSAILHANETTMVLANQPPGVVTSVSQKTLQTEMSQTNVQGGQTPGSQIAQGAGKAGSGGGGAANATETALMATRIALAGVSMGVSGLAISRAGDASDLANEASSSAQGVSGGLSGVNSGLNSVGCALNTLANDEGQTTSPYVPSSGACP